MRGGRQSWAWLGAVVVVLGLLAAGCSGAAASALQPGRTWQLVELRRGNTTISPISSTRAATVAFDEGHLTGSDSVNTHHGAYSEGGDHVTVSGPAMGAVGNAKESITADKVRTDHHTAIGAGGREWSRVPS